MTYKEKSRMKNRIKYLIAGILDMILLIAGMLSAMIGVSAIDSFTPAPAVMMLGGLIAAAYGFNNIIYMEGGDNDEEA